MMKNISDKIQKLRTEYTSGVLDEKAIRKNPLEIFDQWMKQALEAGVQEPNAMSLATVGPDNRPSLRIVLLRGFGEDGFKFFTNYRSKKGLDLTINPYGAITFFWPELERQVRIEGKVEKISEAESDEYFHSRPEGNRLGAWASPQSAELQNREELESMVSAFQTKYKGQEIPRPDFWGGYTLVPSQIEFWQGRQSRLHDRILFKKTNLNWEIVRLAP